MNPYLTGVKKNIVSSTRLPTIKFNNIKIDGTLFQDKDWMMCFHIGFYIYVTDTAKRVFQSNPIALYWWLTKHKLGKFKIISDIKNSIDNHIPWWTYDPDVLVAFSCERDLQTLKFNKYQFFGIDINLYPPDTYQYANDKNIKSIYTEACTWISNLNSFQNNEYIKFRHSNPKKDLNFK